MKASYKISQTDYVNAMKLYGRPTFRALVAYLVIAMGCLLIVIVGSPENRVIALSGCVGGLLGMLIIHFVVLPMLAKQHCLKYKIIQEGMEIELLEKGVIFLLASGENNLLWKNIFQWRKDDSYILIYVMPKLFHLVPKSVVARGFDISALEKS